MDLRTSSVETERNVEAEDRFSSPLWDLMYPIRRSSKGGASSSSPLAAIAMGILVSGAGVGAMGATCLGGGTGISGKRSFIVLDAMRLYSSSTLICPS